MVFKILSQQQASAAYFILSKHGFPPQLDNPYHTEDLNKKLYIVSFILLQGSRFR